MFSRKPVEIDSKEHFFISSEPTELEDFDLIAKKGIKKVIFLTGFERLAEKSEFEKRGIEFFQPDSYEAAFLSINKNCLIHCAAGKGAQVFAMCYLVRNGLPIEKAIEVILHKVARNGALPVHIEQIDRKFLASARAKFVSAHRQEPVILKPDFWRRMKNWALKKRRRI
ncbi:MAG: hypothetical protein PHD95_01080 [Candidatus ainarchaeum sp.]|nr:hypothetical protein [Candidatus ainarchaeum sp.]